MAEHVVLVGLSGTGKSSIGKRVATRLGWRFVDTDSVIEERTGRTVRDIFEREGEAAFRAIEADVMADALDADERTVVAAGGGAVVTEATRRRLQAADVFVIWLTASPEFLASRTAKKAHRPLLDGDPAGALARLASERAAWYREVADTTLDVQPHHLAASKPEAKDTIAGLISAMVQARHADRTRDHIVLIGAMASGKSTVGRLVATALGRPFVDSDEQLRATAGRTAAEIAATDGIDALHTAEVEALEDAMAADEPSVIAAAASVVDGDAGLAALRSAHFVVWLKVAPEVAAARERTGSHRPHVPLDESTRRAPRYERAATFIVETGALGPEAVAEQVLAAVQVRV